MYLEKLPNPNNTFVVSKPNEIINKIHEINTERLRMLKVGSLKFLLLKILLPPRKGNKARSTSATPINIKILTGPLIIVNPSLNAIGSSLTFLRSSSIKADSKDKFSEFAADHKFSNLTINNRIPTIPTNINSMTYPVRSPKSTKVPKYLPTARLIVTFNLSLKSCVRIKILMNGCKINLLKCQIKLEIT